MVEAILITGNFAAAMVSFSINIGNWDRSESRRHIYRHGVMADKFKYRAFISYSHTDRVWGDWLHRALESYRVPKRLSGQPARDGPIPRRLFPIFRDRDELPTSSDLGQQIRAALSDSAYLIVICSPNAAKSRWVNEEILTFKRMGRENRILAMIVRGEPNAEGKPGCTADDECFPPALTLSLAENATAATLEPIAADARQQGDGRNNVKLKLIAGLLGVGFDTLKRRDQEAQAQRRRRWVAAAALAAIIVTCGLWQIVRSSRNAAERQAEALRESSRFLASVADQKRRTGDAVSALLVALEGLPDRANQRPDVADVRRAALDAAAERRELRVFAAGDSQMVAVAISANGQRVATGAADGTGQLWDLQTGRLIAPLTGQKGELRRVEFSPDGQRLLTAASDESNARLWNGWTGEAIAEIAQPAQFTPDGSRIIAGSRPAPDAALGIRLWDGLSGRPLAEIKTTAPVYKILFGSDGRRFLTALGNDQSGVWDSTDWTLLAILRGAPMAISAGGNFVVTTFDHAAMLWDAATGAEIVRLDFAKHATTGCLSPDGSLLAIGAAGGTLSLWGTGEAKKIADLVGYDGDIVSCEFSADGERLVATDDRTIRLWEGRTGSLVASLSHIDHSHDKNKWLLFPRATFARSGSTVLTTNNDDTARLWNAKTGAQIAALAGHLGQITAASFSSDGQFILTACRDGTARLWSVAPVSQTALDDGRLDSAGEGEIVVTTFSPHVGQWQDVSGLRLLHLQGTTEKILAGSAIGGRERAVTVTASGAVSLWNAATGRKIADLAGHKYAVTDAIFNRDGSRLVTYAVPHGLLPNGWPGADAAMLWNAEDGTLIATMGGHEKGILAAAFDASGTSFATTSEDRTARLWDARSGRLVSVLTGHQGLVEGASFSPSGDRLLTRSFDDTARIWSTSDGRLLRVFERSGGGASFSPDGTLVITTSLNDGVATLWDGRAGSKRATLQYDYFAASFSRDGSKLITGSRDGGARIVDTANGSPLLLLKSDQSAVQAVDFSADGRLAVTGSEDGMARLWNATTGEQIGQLDGGSPIFVDKFTLDDKHIVLQSEAGQLRLWPVFADVRELVAFMRQSVPRCLTPRQRLASHLAAVPPDWCVELAKWPYAGPGWRQWLSDGRNGPTPEVDED